MAKDINRYTKKKRGRLISLSDRIRVVELNEAKDNGPG